MKLSETSLTIYYTGSISIAEELKISEALEDAKSVINKHLEGVDVKIKLVNSTYVREL